MHTPTKLLCAVATLAIATGSANADLLGLQLLDVPDITSGFIDVTYDAASDQLVADGFAQLFDDDGSVPSENILNGAFDIAATVDENGNLVGGTVTVGGDVLGFGPTLLTGTLTAFGFEDGGGPIFEFLFTVTGGELAVPYFGGVGTTAGIILEAGSGFGGSFGEDFDNLIGGVPGTGNGSSAVSLIPAPAALALFGMAGLLGRRRRRAD